MAKALKNLVIVGNHIVEKVGTTSTAVIHLAGNALVPDHGYRNVLIGNNYIAPCGSTTPYDVNLSTTGIVNVQIRDNWLNNGGINNASSYISGISGNFGTSNLTRDTNSGTATIPTNAQFINVNHGLLYTPSESDILIRPTNAMGDATKWWGPTNITGSQFRINVNANPTSSTATFAWAAASAVQ